MTLRPVKRKRAKQAHIEWVPSKPLQPKGSLIVEVGALPFIWLTEQGHRLYQHLLQTISTRPKVIDGESFEQFHDNVTDQEVPDYIQSDCKAKDLYQDMIMLTEAILTDKAAGILTDTRPNALASMRHWEDRLHKCAADAEARDRMTAHKGVATLGHRSCCQRCRQSTQVDQDSTELETASS